MQWNNYTAVSLWGIRTNQELCMHVLWDLEAAASICKLNSTVPERAAQKSPPQIR